MNEEEKEIERIAMDEEERDCDRCEEPTIFYGSGFGFTWLCDCCNGDLEQKESK